MLKWRKIWGGIDAIEFQKLSNWGTFTEEEYFEKDVLNYKHSEYEMVVNILKRVLEKSNTKINIIQNII